MKVIYIMGAGHSGSTLLDIALGNHPDVVGVGELFKLHRSGWRRDDDRRCSCGMPIHECAFWRAVRARLSPVHGDGIERYLHLQRKYEGRFSAWLRLAGPARRASADLDEFVRETSALFGAIGEVSGKSVVVDSSKGPRRANALLRNPSIDLRVIHLVRDGRACVWSRMKPRVKDVAGGTPRDTGPVSSLRTTKNWISTNAQSEAVLRRMSPGRFVRVRYEDLVRQPAETLAEIGRATGMDLECVATDLRESRPLEVGHSVGGNRVRMREGLTLNPDFAWTRNLSARDRRRFWSLAGWLARRYRYEKSV